MALQLADDVLGKQDCVYVESPSIFLTFELEGSRYGIDVLKVQEIRGMCHVTPLPNLPSEYRGIINLRGKVVPILDLRARFSLPRRGDGQSVIIVLASSEKLFGLVVDTVSDVLSLEQDQIEQAPQIGGEIDMSLIIGIAKSDAELTTLLDVDELVAA